MCASVSSLFDTWWHTWSLRLLYGRGAHTRCHRGGNLRALWVFLYEKAPLSSVSLFEEGGAAVCFPRFKTHCCRGTEGNELVGLAGGSGWWVREGAFLLAFVGRERGWAAGWWWWCDLADIIWSSGWCSAGLCPGRAGDVWGRWSWGWARSILLPCVWRVTGGYGTRHGEAWLAVEAGQDGGAAGSSRWALSFCHSPPARVSFPFLLDLHAEVEKEWKKPFSARILRFQHTSYANVEGMRENGYEKMPPVEETLASYLSVGETSSLKAPSLPSKPLQETSRLNGKAYAAAGQAVASLHTMAVLQAYQADLLKDLDKGQGLSPDEVAELRHTTDLALRATKQAATAMGRSMAAMVVMERHLWVNLADIGKKEKGFLLDALVLPSELFGTSIETVVEKFREAKARSAAFKSFIPRRSRSEPEQRRGPDPSPSEDQRWDCLRVGLEGGAGQREVGKTWGRWSRRGVLNALVRTRVSETSTPFPRGCTVICPHLPLSNSPATTGYST